jgi:hypothetical protein
MHETWSWHAYRFALGFLQKIGCDIISLFSFFSSLTIFSDHEASLGCTQDGDLLPIPTGNIHQSAKNQNEKKIRESKPNPPKSASHPSIQIRNSPVNWGRWSSVALDCCRSKKSIVPPSACKSIASEASNRADPSCMGLETPPSNFLAHSNYWSPKTSPCLSASPNPSAATLLVDLGQIRHAAGEIEGRRPDLWAQVWRGKGVQSAQWHGTKIPTCQSKPLESSQNRGKWLFISGLQSWVVEVIWFWNWMVKTKLCQ